MTVCATGTGRDLREYVTGTGRCAKSEQYLMKDCTRFL